MDISRCAWKCVAVPAITFGTEFILFSESAFEKLEREQAGWAKETLGLPTQTPNVVAQVLLGVPYVQEVVWTKQLKAFLRLDGMGENRYAAQALWEQRHGGWYSPYLTYINNIREELELLTLPQVSEEIEVVVSQHFKVKLNSKLADLKKMPAVTKIDILERAMSSREGEEARWLNKTIMGVSGVRCSGGEGQWRERCERDGEENSEKHCLTECSVTSRIRKETGVSGFFTACKVKGIRINEAYKYFVTGKDFEGRAISWNDYRERGSSIASIMKTKFKYSLQVGNSS